MHHCLGTSAASQQLVAIGVIGMAVSVNDIRKVKIVFPHQGYNPFYVIFTTGRINRRRLSCFFTSNQVTEHFHVAYGNLFYEHRTPFAFRLKFKYFS